MFTCVFDFAVVAVCIIYDMHKMATPVENCVNIEQCNVGGVYYHWKDEEIKDINEYVEDRDSITEVRLIQFDARHVNAVLQVPGGYEMVDINVASNMSNEFAPVYLKVKDDVGRVFVSYLVNSHCNFIATMPCPTSDRLYFSVDEVEAGFLTSAKIKMSIMFYDKVGQHQSVVVKNEQLDVNIRNIPLWVTTRTIVPTIAADSDVSKIDAILAAQDLVRAGVYKKSHVAKMMTSDGGIVYSVNYTYMHKLAFCRETIIHHLPFLREMCPTDLHVVSCGVIDLNIDGEIVSKLQVAYKQYVEAAIPEGSEIMFYDATTKKDQRLWQYLCSACAFEGIEYRQFNDFDCLILQKVRDDSAVCSCKRLPYTTAVRQRISNIPLKPILARFESEGVTDGEEKIHTSNVVLSETQQESIDMASAPVLPMWHSLASSEYDPSFTDMCDRFIPWRNFTWSTEKQSENYTLISEVLPLAFLNSKGGTYCNTVNFIPFNVHAYWRGDMEIKVHVNSNMFQSGQLIASWLYGSDSFATTQTKEDVRYTNIAQLVQKPHIKISAGASNEATLYVPFRYVKPYMRTKPVYKGTVAALQALNMGRFVLRVMVPLMTGTAAASPKVCNGTIFIRFVNSSFTGKFSGDIAKPEMAGILNAVDRVAGVVDKVLGDINCDNPPDTTPAPFWVPINAQNWSHGTNAREPINTLRLDGRAVGVGRSPDIGYSDTNIKGIQSIYGLLRPFEWQYADTAKNVYGKMLWGMAVHPQCDKDRMYSSSQNGNDLATYTIPPVGVIASLFCYWRGSLNFKFELIATSKHTGRILVGYIPGVADYRAVTLEQALSSPNVEFSLNTGTTSFTFTVPYVAETMWWQRKYGGAQRAADFIAPSSIVVFVLNPLVPMESVAQKVVFLPYIAAGDDFEVAVPAQPSIGLGVVRYNEAPNKDFIAFKDGYYPVYLGSWRSLTGGTKQIFRYGNVSDHVAQVTTPVKAQPGNVVIYAPSVPIRGVFKYGISQKANDGANYKDSLTGRSVNVANQTEINNGALRWAVVWSVDGYNYMLPVLTTLATGGTPDKNGLNNAVILAAHIQNNSLHTVEGLLMTYYGDSDWINNSQNIKWRAYQTPVKGTIRANFEMASEREVTPNALQPTQFLPSTNNGSITFGERFFDLKDLCRRYQLYWEGTVAPGFIRENKRNAAFVQIPVMPQGLKLKPTLDNPVWNSMRDGHIPVISSGFRFYRGGVRMRIVVTGLNDSIWVQHHPDRYFYKQEPTIGKDIHDKDAYRNHAYGFHVQNLSVNRTIEVEIPFYKPGLYNLLGDMGQDFDANEYGTLGDIVIGLEGDQPVNDPIDIAVYYTISDDCSFNIFCGFPDMVFCDEVYKQNDQYRVSETNEEQQDFNFEVIPYAYAQREMMAVANVASNSVSSMLGSLVGNLAFNGSKIVTAPLKAAVKEEIKVNVLPAMKDIENEVRHAAEDISATLGRTLPQQAIISALGQFSQVALNPTPSALAIAVSSLLANFVTISMELLLSVQQALTNFLSRTWCKYFSGASDLQEAQTRSTPEGFIDDMPEKSLHGFLGMLFTAVASTIGISVAEPKQYPNIMKGVRESLNTCNAAVVFFRNTVDAIVYLYKYCLGETDEELKAKIIIEREYPHMKDWCDEVMLLLDPRNSNTILHSSKQANRVFDACMYGAKLINDNLDKNIPGGKVVYDLYTKVCKLRDDLIELGNHPDIRFETFPIWVCGDAGVGKSFMTQKICQELLQSIDYRTQECMIYWLALGQKYWNGIKNPPVIARDEAYAVGGQFTEEEIATHLAICSSSILNPPMAALQEKNKRLNPLIYYMNSNMEFPQINEARHPEAIYRRRKLMVKVQYTDDIKQRFPGILDASELPANEKVNMQHLEFWIARDPKNKDTTYAGPYDYIQFIGIAKQKFKDHVQQERINFRNRMSAAYSLDPEYDQQDELNYVHGSTLPSETLHEVYLRQRNAARLVLYVPPPSIDENEDPYLSRILQRFSYLWTPADIVLPEMDNEEESSSKGFYTEEARILAQKIAKGTHLSRGAIMKLVSGGMCYEDNEINAFVIDPEFECLIKEKKIQSSFGVAFEYNSMLPNFVTDWARKSTFDDSWIANGKIHKHKVLPHWDDVTGVDCLRSYVYWACRQYQYKTFVKYLLEEDLRRESFVQAFRRSYAGILSERQIDLILHSTSVEEMLDTFKRLEFNQPTHEQLVELVAIVYFLNVTVSQYETEFCQHCRFWIDKLHNTGTLEYNARYDTLTYVNTLGLRVKFENYCNCLHALSSNPLFRNSLRIIWNHDHGTTDHPACNPFSFAEFRARDELLKAWYVRILEWVKDWWKGVGHPFVSTILTFVYEHFGKIIAILLGLYALYSWYNKAEVTRVAAPVVKRATDLVGEAANAAAGVFIGTVVAKHDVEPIVSDDSAQPQSAGYCKVDKPKPAMANFRPAHKENDHIIDPIEILEQKLLNNVCHIEARWEDPVEKRTKMLSGRCIGIRERQVLVIKHYIEEMLTKPINPTFMINYVCAGKPCTGFLTRECFEKVTYFSVGGQTNASNFGVLRLPKYMPMFKDILNSIVRKADHHYVGSVGHLMSVSMEGRISRHRQLPLRPRAFLVIGGEDDNSVSSIYNDGAYEYSVHGRGMCGSLLLADKVCRGNPGIIGLHVAGMKGNGFAEPIYREMFEHKKLEPEIQYVLPQLMPAEMSSIDLDSNLLTLGCVEKKLSHHESGKSKIVPSLIHGKVYSVKTEPNPLAPNDPRQPAGSHPLKDGCNKHGFGYSIPFDEKILDIVSHDNRMVLRNEVRCPLVKLRELTLEEAICGTSLIPHCESLNWKSSEGFPLSSFRPQQFNNKKYLFDLEEHTDGYKLKGLAPELQQILQVRHQFRERNICVPPIYIDCLKDYRLTPEKCAIPGKTRIFSIAPVQVTIDLRRYMGVFLSAYRAAGVEAQHGIGINVDSIEWTKLANYLLEVGDNIVTGDYSNFGPTLSSQIVYSCIEDIIDWHKFNNADEAQINNLRFILENEILNPIHLCQDLVYQTVNGIASGSPITAELNSEVNKKYVKLAFVLLCKKYNFNYTLKDFNHHCRLVTYGDDFIMSVSDEFIEWFNCLTISNVLREHGIILTDAQKGKEVIPFRSLFGSTFLKRTFKKHPFRKGIWLAPIEEQSITECLNWCHKQSDMRAATEEVIRASCVLAFGHGPKYYRQHTDKIHKVAKQEGLLADYASWEDMDRSYFG